MIDNDLIDLASQIESQAKEFQRQVNAGGNFMLLANSLMNNVTTLVFTTGAAYATNPVKFSSNSSSQPVKQSNYRHSLRGAGGRFVPKPRV